MNRKLLKLYGAVVLTAILLVTVASPVFAIVLPDSTPTVESKYCYRNVLETGDFLIIVYENTPYSSTPNVTYSEAFIWRLFDTDGTTELAQALGYTYHNSGYGYNVIAFYFSAENAPDGYWQQPYYITLSGTPSAFESPPKYTYSLQTGDYSSLTDTADVKAAVTATILNLAQDLDIKWGLDADESLLTEAEVGTVLSLYGQAFFRGAIYGVQAMAPNAFPLIITNITAADREWTPEYVDELVAQYEGTDIETAVTAGESLFDVNYNLMGILATLGICVVIIAANWYLAGGNLWRGLIDSAGPLVIAGRLALFGLGELGLLAAVCWLYISAKIWKVI